MSCYNINCRNRTFYIYTHFLHGGGELSPKFQIQFVTTLMTKNPAQEQTLSQKCIVTNTFNSFYILSFILLFVLLLFSNPVLLQAGLTKEVGPCGRLEGLHSAQIPKDNVCNSRTEANVPQQITTSNLEENDDGRSLRALLNFDKTRF